MLLLLFLLSLLFCLWFASSGSLHTWIHIKHFHMHTHTHIPSHTGPCMHTLAFILRYFTFSLLCVQVSEWVSECVCLYIIWYTKDCFSRLNGIKEVCLFHRTIRKMMTQTRNKTLSVPLLVLSVDVSMCMCVRFLGSPPYAFEAMNCFIFATGFGHDFHSSFSREKNVERLKLLHKDSLKRIFGLI